MRTTLPRHMNSKRLHISPDKLLKLPTFLFICLILLIPNRMSSILKGGFGADGAQEDKKTRRLVLNYLLEGGGSECLVSYAAVEAGAIRLAVSRAAFKVADLVGGMASKVRYVFVSCHAFNLLSAR